MEKKSLHIAIHEAIKQFGIDVLKQSRLMNILLDFGAFSDVPAAKSIIQAMISVGFTQKIIDLGKQKSTFLLSVFKSNDLIDRPEGEEWKQKLTSYSTIFSRQNGFLQPLVSYVVECIVYGLGWSDVIPEIPQSQTVSNPQSIPLGPQPITVNNNTSSGTNTNKVQSVSYHSIDDTQFLVMKVSPANAEVYIDGQQQYVSNGIMAVELRVGNHSYEVKAENYETSRGTLNLSSSNKCNIDVALQLIKQNIKLSIETGDIDAEIFINGVCYGKGKWDGLVEEGTYEIEARKFRYYPQTKIVSLQGENSKKVSIPCLIAKTGNLKVNVQPYGSTIFINGNNEGTTPLLIQNVVIGDRKLTIKTDEGSEYSTIVEVRENQVTDVNHIIPSLFLDDYSQVKLFDYFYEDGTFSHKLAKGKNVSGIVFSLDTSEEEKAQGWTHGQIIATKDAANFSNKISSWGIPSDEMLKYAVKRTDIFTYVRDSGFLVSHLDTVVNNPEFVPFEMASKYDGILPWGKTSGWYLPSIVQWRKFFDNTCSRWEDIWRFLQLNSSNCRGKTYASSSLVNNIVAWRYNPGIAEKYKELAFKTENINSGWNYVRAVAAF